MCRGLGDAPGNVQGAHDARYSAVHHHYLSCACSTAPHRQCSVVTPSRRAPSAVQYLDGAEVDCDLIFDNGRPVYGAITDNWPTVEPYFNETGSNCPSVLPKAAQIELLELSVRAVQVGVCINGAGVRIGPAQNENVVHMLANLEGGGHNVLELSVRAVQVGGDEPTAPWSARALTASRAASGTAEAFYTTVSAFCGQQRNSVWGTCRVSHASLSRTTTLSLLA